MSWYCETCDWRGRELDPWPGYPCCPLCWSRCTEGEGGEHLEPVEDVPGPDPRQELLFPEMTR